MKKFLSLFLLIFCFLLNAQNQFIPQPRNLEIKNGTFRIPNIILISNELPSVETQYLINQLKSHFEFKIAEDSKAHISKLKSNQKFDNEAYSIQIDSKKIQIGYTTDESYFRAVQTLVQLFNEHRDDKSFSAMKIDDYPQFKWRGMHLDVVRHFFTVDEVKKYLDYLAMYKMNTFHWHLTDDQGWRIEIKKYPKLTEIGSKRKESMIGPYGDDKYDVTPYGGFFTQEEIKDVINYAKKLHINIVPEIEMPGHALAALSAYPELACTDGPFEAATKWGVFDDVFCPKEETFEFLQNVLTEVIALFPSEYIHIGGDECPKTRWKECVHCQELIKKENLGDEHGLQSYFIRRIGEFVSSKGRKIIGWNEILEGGLAPGAAVMSWTGEEGGIEAARLKHFAVMTPGGYCYFDHYQGDPQNEPLAFGGYTPLDKIYGYHPIPSVLTTEEGKFILGVQANLWAEYILDFKHIEYMLFPRLMALSEAAWGTNKPEKYLEFEKKVVQHFKYLDEKGVNYSKSIFNPSGKVVRHGKGIAYELYLSKNIHNIRFTTDGSEPNNQSEAYKKPIPVTESMTIKSGYFEDGQLKSAISSQRLNISKSTGKPLVLVNQPSPNYAFGGELTLVDGIEGDSKVLGKTWLGFSGTDVVATIDMGEKTNISKIYFNSLKNIGSWIHLAKGAKVFVSDDGKNFKEAGEIGKEKIDELNGKVVINFVPALNARYLRIEIYNAGIIPAGNPGAGSAAWLFVDEIGVK